MALTNSTGLLPADVLSDPANQEYSQNYPVDVDLRMFLVKAPMILDVTQADPSVENYKAKVTIQAKNCEENDCSVVFQGRNSSASIEVPISIKSTLQDSNGYKIQTIDAIVPNLADPNGGLYLVSKHKYQSNIWRELPSICMLEPGLQILSNSQCN